MITDFLPANPLFNSNAKIYEVQTLEYENRFKTKDMISIVKYMYPEELKTNYEYIEFRHQIDKAQVQNTKALGVILFPKEKFVPIDSRNVPLKESIDFFIEQNLLLSPENHKYTTTTILESLFRVEIYRVSFRLDEKYLLTYEIDVKNSAPSRLISNISLIQPVVEVKPPQPIALPPTPTPQPKPPVTFVFNLVFFLERFPSRRIPPVTMTIVTSPMEDDTQLTQSELQSTISSFFKLQVEAIANIRLLRRISLYQLIDTYTVDYTELFPTRNLRSFNYRPSRKCRFVFQAARRKSLNSGFLNLRSSASDDPLLLVIQNDNSSSQVPDTVVVSATEVEKKPIKVLSALFNKSFSV